MAHEQDPESSILALRKQYDEHLPLAHRLEVALRDQMLQLIGDTGVHLSVPIQHRVKDWESVQEKIERKSLDIEEITSLSDLVGLRLILQFRRDVSTVCDLLASHFEIIERQDTRDRLQDDQFGYASVHFVLQLRQAWLSVPTMTSLRGLRAEVQVRTTAQHIWAAASHTLQYKKESSVPPEIKRAIYRVSALLETVDLEFERVLADRDAYREHASELSSNTELNSDLLEALLDELLPPQNKEPSREDYAELIEQLRAAGIGTEGQLRALLNKQLANALRLDSENVRSQLTGSYSEDEESKFDYDRARKGVYFVHTGLVRMALSQEFPQQERQRK